MSNLLTFDRFKRTEPGVKIVECHLQHNGSPCNSQAWWLKEPELY